MSSRPLLKPQSVFTNVVLSANRTSLVTNINMISIFSYTVFWTGTPTGEFTVEVSNDYVPSPEGVLVAPANAGHWVAIPLDTDVLAVGDDGSAFIDVATIGAAWARLLYTRTSGTGTVNATITGKVS